MVKDYTTVEGKSIVRGDFLGLLQSAVCGEDVLAKSQHDRSRLLGLGPLLDRVSKLVLSLTEWVSIA